MVLPGYVDSGDSAYVTYLCYSVGMISLILAPIDYHNLFIYNGVTHEIQSRNFRKQKYR
jgi:hypothetical protein